MKDINLEKLYKMTKTDDEVHEQLMDALIIAGCHEHIKHRASETAKEQQIEVHSPNFNILDTYIENIKKKEQSKKRHRTFNKVKDIAIKVAACLSILFIISIITVTSSEAARVAFLNTYVEVFEIKTDFSIISDDEKTDTVSEMQQFEYIPSGFEVTETFDDGQLYKVKYETENGDFVNIKVTYETTVSIDSEDAEATKKVIEDKICYISYKEETVNVLFIYNERGYVITSNISMGEIEKIIQNMK